MRNARVTVLMTPAEKSDLEAEAAKSGVSSGEFIRLAVDNFDARDREAELGLLTSELAASLPQMREDFTAMVGSMRSVNEAIEAYRAEKVAKR